MKTIAPSYSTQDKILYQGLRLFYKDPDNKKFWFGVGHMLSLLHIPLVLILLFLYIPLQM